MTEEVSKEVEPREPIDLQTLNQELDWVMAQIFMGKNSAFLGTLMSSLNFVWTRDIPTAQTNGVSLWWNPDWFMYLPRETRITIMLHELQHPAKLHFLRMGERQHKIWNYATDIIINNELHEQGYKFDNFSPWINMNMHNWVEEDVYDHLLSLSDEEVEAMSPPMGGWNPFKEDFPTFDGDMCENMTDEQIREAVNNVIMADQAAQARGEPGLGEGTKERVILNQFLAPIVPWEAQLNKWMGDLCIGSHSWRRPSRRYTDMYMPSRFIDEGRLDHLMYLMDVSGSIKDGDSVRFNSEVKYVWETFKPKKMTLVQFDDIIQKVDVIEDGEEFNQIEIIGRGGNTWKPVKEFIDEHEPTAAIIFTDLHFYETLDPPKESIPILWICLNNPGANPPFGDILHIRC